MPTFYRIVITNPPTEADFRSNAAKGLLPHTTDPEVVRLWDGISVYATLAQARRKLRQRPALGAFIAELTIPTDAAVRYERTTSSDGHHTLWGDPASLLALVTAIVARSAQEGAP